MEAKNKAMEAGTSAQGGLEVQPCTLKMKTNGPTEICLGWPESRPTSMQPTESASGGGISTFGNQNSANPISSLIDGVVQDPIGSAAKALKFLI